MTVWAARGLVLAGLGLVATQVPGIPPALQSLGGVGTFLLGAAAMGWVGVQAWKTFKRSGNSGSENGAAERRTNAGVSKIVERIDRNYELTRVEAALVRDTLLTDLKKTRHDLGVSLTAPVLELGRDLRELKDILIQIRERLPMRNP